MSYTNWFVVGLYKCYLPAASLGSRTKMPVEAVTVLSSSVFSKGDSELQSIAEHVPGKKKYIHSNYKESKYKSVLCHLVTMLLQI